jgi:N-acyl-L-homoserine lactone synthetase
MIRDNMEKQNLKVVMGKQEDIPVHLFEKALSLRYKIYSDEGFVPKLKSKKDYDDHDKHAIHVLALDGEEVVGYMRLVESMPLLSLYKKEVEEVLEQNGFSKFIELSRLVVKPECRVKKEELKNYKDFISFLLFKKAYNYLVGRKVDSVFIAVHPKYKERYKKFYNFKQHGDEKEYGTVCGNPAVLLYQNIQEATENVKKINKKFIDFMFGDLNEM